LPVRNLLIGLTNDEIDARSYGDVQVIGVQDSRGRRLAGTALIPDSILVVRGQGDSVARFAADHDLTPHQGLGDGSAAYGLVSPGFGVAEVIVTPRSNYIGETAFPGMVTDSGKLVVLAVQRQGEDLAPSETRLRAGDSM
jgi:hypothetical protein